MMSKRVEIASKWSMAMAVLVLAGCVSSGGTSTPPAEKTKPVAKAQPAAKATSPAQVAGASAIVANKDMGTVVFFRPSKFVGGAISFKVREGTTELGKLSSGSYFVATLPPGPHEFTVHSEAKDVLNIELERGAIYYLEGSVSFGALVGRPNLSPSDAAAFEGVRAKLKNSASKT